MLGLVVGTVCVNNESRILQDGLAGFLSIRITPLNASFCFVFAVLWNQCMEKLGLYQNDFKNFTSLMIHTAVGCSIMTMFLALYLGLRQAKEFTALVLISFFVITFTLELCRALVVNRQLRRFVEPRRVVILGSGRRASKAWRECLLIQ